MKSLLLLLILIASPALADSEWPGQQTQNMGYKSVMLGSSLEEFRTQELPALEGIKAKTTKDDEFCGSVVLDGTDPRADDTRYMGDPLPPTMCGMHVSCIIVDFVKDQQGVFRVASIGMEVPDSDKLKEGLIAKYGSPEDFAHWKYGDNEIIVKRSFKALAPKSAFLLFINKPLEKILDTYQDAERKAKETNDM